MLLIVFNFDVKYFLDNSSSIGPTILADMLIPSLCRLSIKLINVSIPFSNEMLLKNPKVSIFHIRSIISFLG